MARSDVDYPCSTSFRAFFNDEPNDRRRPRSALDLTDAEFRRHIRRGGGLSLEDPLVTRVRTLETELARLRAELRRVEPMEWSTPDLDTMLGATEYRGILQPEGLLHACCSTD